MTFFASHAEAADLSTNTLLSLGARGAAAHHYSTILALGRQRYLVDHRGAFHCSYRSSL